MKFKTSGYRIDAVGDAQIAEVQRLLERYNIDVACISPKLFGGLPVSTLQITEPAFQAEINRLKHCIEIAHKLRAPAIRVMSAKRKEACCLQPQWSKHLEQ